MKKITLVLILVFTWIAWAIFIGSANIKKTNSTTQDSTIKQINNKSTKDQKINDSTNNIINKSTKNINLTKNRIKHLNDINLNISQLTFNSETSTADTFSINQVSKHNTKNDCYLIINNKVYDVSNYISYHPWGSRTIVSRCGEEVSGIFARIHSNRAWDLLKKYKIGTITINQPDTTPQILNAIKNALKNANPNADIIKVSPKQNFYIAKVIFNNKLYEIHIDNSGKIIKEEVEDDESNWSIWENDKDDK